LQKYLKAKHWLTEVTKAMAVTVAAAALAGQVRLLAAAPVAAAAGADAAEGLLQEASAKIVLPAVSDRADQPCKDQDSSLGAAAPSSCSTCDAVSSNSISSGDSSSRRVLVRQGTADLLAALCSSWDDLSQAIGKAPPTAAGSGLGAGSILAHMLPSRWGLAGSKQQQHHAQHAHEGEDSGSTEAPLGLVYVDAADLRMAWQRLLCISTCLSCAALGQATAAAALAPLSSCDWQIRAAPAGAAVAPAGSDDNTGRSSSDSARASAKGHAQVSSAVAQKAAADLSAAPAQLVDTMPCVMHVVGHGETLQRIASVCSLGVSDLLAANPEIPAPDAVHHNDCIAVPVPVVFPRLYVSQPGDTLHSIARAHEVPLGRLLAKNPELADSSRVQPGWVVALPGLKGDSQVALPADWLAKAALCASDVPEQAATWALPQQAYSQAVDAEAQLQVTVPHGEQQQHQQGLIATPTWPSGAPQQRQRSRQQRQRLKHGSGAAGVSVCVPGPVSGSAHVPPVGSGAFLFTVGSSSSSSIGSRASAGHGSTSQEVAAVSQKQAGQRYLKKGGSSKGSSGSRAGGAAHGLATPHGWAVENAAGAAY
jgi:LysM repeat protein